MKKRGEIMNTKLEMTNLKIIGEDGNETDIASSVVECVVDIGNGESESVSGIFLGNEKLTINISDATIKNFHRRKKRKRYLIYFYEEYSLFDDFKNKVFGEKIKHKKYRKIGSNE